MNFLSQNFSLLSGHFVSYSSSLIFFLFYFFIVGFQGTRRNAKGDGPKLRDPGNRMFSENGRRKRRRKGNKKRKGKPGRLQVYGGAYRQLKNDIGYIMSVINVEDKRVDNTSTQAFTAAWQLLILNGLVLGTTATTRNGQSVKWTGMEARLTVRLGAAASNTASIVIFYDRSPNAVAPVGLDVYAVAGVLSPRNASTISRFHILHDERYALDTVQATIIPDGYSKNLNTHTNFNTGNAGTIADIQEGAYYLAWICDTSVTFPSFDVYTRFLFVDN